MAERSGPYRLATLAFVLGAGAAAAACAQSEGISPSPGFGGEGGVDASVGGTAGAAGSGVGGSAGSSATGGTSGQGGVGATGGTSGSGGAGATGGMSGGSGTGATGGSGGTGGGGTGGTAGTGATGGTGGTGATGGTGGSGGSAGCDIIHYAFSGCPTGWQSGGNNNDWGCGTPQAPGGDHTGGGQAWGTNVTGNSSNCADSTLTSPVINLSAYQGLALKLRFWHWHEFRACNTASPLCGLPCAFDKSTYSGGLVEVYDGSNWVKVAPPGGYSTSKIECYSVDPEAGTTCAPCALDGQAGFAGSSGGWQLVEMDISSYAHAAFQFRFHFASYAAEFLCHPAKAGWYIDDVSIAKLSCP